MKKEEKNSATGISQYNVLKRAWIYIELEDPQQNKFKSTP